MCKKIIFYTFLASVLVLSAGHAGETLSIEVEGRDLVTYQAKPMSNPKGGDKFRGSNFIHPLKTPSGFVVTEIQPGDHLHHFGLWWPWKYVERDGRKVLCWELQKGDGLIQAQESHKTKHGFTAESIYIDRKADGGPETFLEEKLNVRTSGIVEKPAKGYFLDIGIVHEAAGDKPLTIVKYRYSGFALRGTSAWNKNNSSVLTSAGKDYSESNFTRAKWVKIEGDNGEGEKDIAGVIMMSHPDNHAHPEKLRTWNPGTHNGAIFVNFNPVQNKPWKFEPEKEYTRRYRLFVYDGTLTAKQAEGLWRKYEDASQE